MKSRTAVMMFLLVAVTFLVGCTRPVVRPPAVVQEAPVVEPAAEVRAFPQLFVPVFLKDPATTRTLDVERMSVGASITVHLRALSQDTATRGELFTLPPDARVNWRATPAPPMGAELRITPLDNQSANIEVVRAPQIEMPSSIGVVVTLVDGTTREAAFIVEIAR